MSDHTSKPPVAIDVSLKAEATMGLKAEIPSSSMGRLVDAITDTFRPFSEARGLRGDQIRLQRAEIAIKIAEMARSQLEAKQIEIQPVAPKVLVPLIEKASLEEPESDMVQRWANLLAKAASPGGIHPRLVQILSEIDGKQVALLERVSLNGMDKYPFPHTKLEDTTVELGSIHTEDFIYSITSTEYATPESILETFEVDLSRPGSMFLASLIASESLLGLDTNIPNSNLIELDIEICESLGLMKLVRVPLDFDLGSERHWGFLAFCHLTSFGINLIEACAPNVIHSLKAAQLKNRNQVLDEVDDVIEDD